MEAVIKEYHGIAGPVKHVTNWELSTPAIAAKLPPGGKLDLTKLGLGTTSMRDVSGSPSVSAATCAILVTTPCPISVADTEKPGTTEKPGVQQSPPRTT